ncbi:MAG TPA: hypothetical protein VGR61_06300 [Candidatus Dormibacteraeota bacterium]|nr:hypothetical protein [Candidatus Dormibacteraeota bacterium]
MAVSAPGATRAVRVAVAVLLFHGLWIGLFLGLGHDPIDFVHVGLHQLQRSTSSPLISGLAHNPHVTETIGNDGQFAYYMALDPAHARYYVDHDSYRYARFLYPLLARVMSFGQAALLPTVLLVLNLAAVAGGTLAVALWLVRKRLNPWLALFYGLFPGMMFSLRFDFGEPVAYGLVAWAIYVFEFGPGHRWVGAAVLFALAAVSRETALVFAAGYFIALGLGGPPGRVARALAFGAIAAGPLLAVKATLWGLWGSPGAGPGLDLPFAALLHPRAISCLPDCGPFDPSHIYAEMLVIVLPALIACAIAVTWVARRGWSPAAFNLLLNTLLYIVVVNREAFLGFPGSFRFSIPIMLAALFCLPAVPALGRPARTAAMAAGAIWMASAPVWLLRALNLLGGI